MKEGFGTVSYTHLDVYKRQEEGSDWDKARDPDDWGTGAWDNTAWNDDDQED